MKKPKFGMHAVSLDYLYSGGRLRGIYLYMLFCPDGDLVHIKIGQSGTPFSRLKGLIKIAPCPPEQFCLTEVPGRSRATGIEHLLHRACARWRTGRRSDWFQVPMADKVQFRTLCTGALNLVREPRWPMAWTWIDVPAYLAENRQQTARHQAMLRQSSGPESFAALVKSAQKL